MERCRPLILAACMLTVVLANGCGNACLTLADNICSCQPSDTLKTNCQQRARDQDAIFSVRSQDEQYCQGILDSGKCDCTRLDTPEGRAACGLNYGAAPADVPSSR
jgi:hypothetical protein